MADDAPTNRLVMTPMLQMAVRLLQTRTSELPIAQWRQDYPGLVDLAPGEPDEIDDHDRASAEQELVVPWEALAEPPLPVLAKPPDVFVFGNPPQARANRDAWPRWKATDRDAAFLVRALRQRARSYEAVTRALVALRPELALSLEPAKLEPVPVDAIAEAAGMHASTITRIAMALRFQNLHGLIALTTKGTQVGFRPG